uniref:Actin-related protein 2/3 complex subunit 3 n=1 Tax=Fibrocapsa japonica TaxID=94617 RepID=A0A7S2UXZ0_9STRA|mmetsp:Transcript_19676/g.28427  ORF Transcript_19676/g.28427 Transcript_19676/m.28427 type:complete len:177 (+) Transcript_19676:67-597(+)
MPAYHSKFISDNYEQLCSCAVMPIKTSVRGPAPSMPEGEDVDVIDECLSFYRANVLFYNFNPTSSADHTLVYLTLYTQLCLRTLDQASITTPDQASSALRELAYKTQVMPGHPNWPLGSWFQAPESDQQRDAFQLYFNQVREELGARLVGRVFADGSKSKWWLAFSKRKFLGKELR